MKIKSDGLVYRLATYFDGEEPSDFCHLVRAVVWRSFVLIVLCVLSGAALGDFLAWLVSVIINGWTPISNSVGATAIIAITAIISYFFLIFFVFNACQDDESKVGEVARFVSAAYKAKKNKFCPRVEIE